MRPQGSRAPVSAPAAKTPVKPPGKPKDSRTTTVTPRVKQAVTKSERMETDSAGEARPGDSVSNSDSEEQGLVIDMDT